MEPKELAAGGEHDDIILVNERTGQRFRVLQDQVLVFGADGHFMRNERRPIEVQSADL